MTVLWLIDDTEEGSTRYTSGCTTFASRAVSDGATFKNSNWNPVRTKSIPLVAISMSNNPEEHGSVMQVTLFDSI